MLSIIGVFRFLSSVLNFRVCNPDYNIPNPDSDTQQLNTENHSPEILKILRNSANLYP